MALRETAKAGVSWTQLAFNVPGTTILTGNNEMYEYKLPYTVQEVGCCTRIHPMLYCCDIGCCVCCQPKGDVTFMDMVNQESGEQIRFRTQKKTCFQPKMLSFMNGQYLGEVSRTMRCCHSCLQCYEDCSGQDVLLLGLHDDNGTQLAKIRRNGSKCCCQCSCDFPMKCAGCCFVCATTSLSCKPQKKKCCRGCLECDPVCGENCLRSEDAICKVEALPVMCIGCCGAACTLFCCSPMCVKTPLNFVSTLKVEQHDVVNSTGSADVGVLQFQYRGNFGSAYVHDTTKPLTGYAAAQNPTVGKLLSSVIAGKAFTLGAPAPMFMDLHPRPEGKSPDFDGLVICHDRTQMNKLTELLRPDLIVSDDLVLGSHISGIQVKGWRLHSIGYADDKVVCCGQKEKPTKPEAMYSVQEVKDLITVALEGKMGDNDVVFTLRFLPYDQERQIFVPESNLSVVNSNFNPAGGGFAAPMEAVSLSCVCFRVCRCEGTKCSTTPKKTVCCKCPLYAQALSQGSVKVAPAFDKTSKPPQVVMRYGQK